MTTTPTSRPAWKGQPEPVGLEETLLRLLPDEVIYNTAQLFPGQSNLEFTAAWFANFNLKAPTQATLDAEAKRRTAANRDPAADPSPSPDTLLKPKPRPGDQGRAMAAKRFGVKK